MPVFILAGGERLLAKTVWGFQQLKTMRRCNMASGNGGTYE